MTTVFVIELNKNKKGTNNTIIRKIEIDILKQETERYDQIEIGSEEIRNT